MDEETKLEKEFSEKVDKMLAGQKVEIDTARGGDYADALNFVQKLIELRADHRLTFQARLKASLLSKLSESEQEAKPSSFWKGWLNMVLNSLNKPAWRVVTPVILVVVLVGSVLWATGILPGLIGRETVTPPPPIPAPGPLRPPLEVNATIGKSSYSVGEEVKVEFSFKNVSSSPVQMEPFPPAVGIMQPTPYNPIRLFSAGTETRRLNLGETATYTVTWDQRDNEQKQVAYGYYYIELGDMQVGGFHMKPSFGMTAPILILPDEGVMEKTIEVNKLQTVGGITITLERIELSASGMKVYVFNTPPGYNLPQGPQLPPPSMMIHAEAEYSIDGGAPKMTGPSAIRFLENGTEHIWENLNPVPKSAKELTIRITKLGDWQGPWEFKVSLD